MNTEKRFNYYSDYRGIEFGFYIKKPYRCTGWGWYVGFDFLFFSCWMYFKRINQRNGGSR